jgi:hypothetical protein
MTRIEGTAIVAWWLIGSAALALARLVARGDDILRHLDGWRAAGGPLLVAVLALVAGIQLLRDGRSRLSAAVLSVQVFALSAGALAFRLDVGPFVRLGVTAEGLRADAGNDARLFAILGAENHIPWGVAVNLLALAALLILAKARRTTLEAHAG